MGLYTILIYLLGTFAVSSISVNYTYFVIGLIQIFTAIPMLVSKKSLSRALCDSRIAGAVLFSVLGLSRESIYRESSHSEIRTAVPFVLGSVFGAMTLIFSPLNIMLFIGSAILIYLLLVSPESGMVILISCLPFMSENMLMRGLLFVLFCFILKAARGKRTFRFELNDYAVLAFALMVVTGNIFSINYSLSLKYTCRMLCYMSSYFLIVNMVRTKPWIRRVTASVIFSMLVCVVCGLIQKFALGVDFILVEELVGNGAVRGTFGSPDILAQYLLLCVFFLFALYLRTETRIRRTFILLLCIAAVLCLYYTMSPWAMVCFILAAVLFFMIYTNRTIIAVLCVLLVSPFARYILPSSVIAKISEIVALGQNAAEYRIKVWKISLMMARDYFIGGSGSGTYTYLYNQYAAEGMETLPSAYNIYLQTTVEIGIFGLIALIAIIFVFSQSNFSFFAKQGGGKHTVYAQAGFSGVFGILLLGLTDNIWQDPRLFLAFWTVMGLTMAIKRQSVNEQRGLDDYLVGWKM